MDHVASRMSARRSIDPRRPDPATLAEAVRVIEAGGIVAFPTETFYGLAVNPADAAAVRALFRVKGRDAASAVPLVAADVEQVESQIAQLSPDERRLVDRGWPGPLALLLEAPDDLARDLHAGTHTVAVRVPGHAVARTLARHAGRPLTATSANPSGMPPATSADEVQASLGPRLDLVLDAGATPGGAPSTIVRVGRSGPVLVRAGAVPWDRVLEFLGRDE